MVTSEMREIIINDLKKEKEIIPDEHDGSYELMRETIRSYMNIKNTSVLNYKDLNLVYLMSVGTWKKGIYKRKETINESNLPKSEKKRLIGVMDRIWQNAIDEKYKNIGSTKPCFGMFGTGFFSFKDKTDKNTVIRFINLCTEIIDMEDDDEIFNKADEVLDKDIRGMKAASASMILHCLKPYTFPIFNSNMGNGNIFEILGVDLDKKTEIYTYVKNCRAVKSFRDENFDFKNYRVFDIVASNPKYDEDYEYYYDNNLILYGPPGTGKTYNTINYAVAICDKRDIYDLEDYDEVLSRYNELKKQGRIEFTTFHQSYGYEEFIEGISPETTTDGNLTYKLKDGIFKAFCKRAIKIDNKQPYVFIIDEINRGNISKIFGELITLIEESKRLGREEGMEVVLPYSGETFGVPDNVYIVGTMNTADRSIALMDTALRRRFKFIEKMPDADILREVGADIVEDEYGEEIDVALMLEIINERIEYLYDREHTIGHAFFTELKDDNSIEKLGNIFEESIIPLLQEYFYEDYSKIQLVLGDNCKSSDDYKFILDEKLIAKDLFNGNVDDIDLPDKKYMIQEEAFWDINSYREIGEGI